MKDLKVIMSGPHGSGKTTILDKLSKEIDQKIENDSIVYDIWDAKAQVYQTFNIHKCEIDHEDAFKEYDLAICTVDSTKIEEFDFDTLNLFKCKKVLLCLSKIDLLIDPRHAIRNCVRRGFGGIAISTSLNGLSTDLFELVNRIYFEQI
jgi:signal recognition particle receptor subunit beta